MMSSGVLCRLFSSAYVRGSWGISGIIFLTLALEQESSQLKLHSEQIPRSHSALQDSKAQMSARTEILPIFDPSVKYLGLM